MKKPIDFFCFGSAKSGTTWLFDKLKHHPQLYIPEEKEIHYFNTYKPEYQDVENPNLKIGQSYLEEKYRSADMNKLWGDFSTSYLNDEKSAKRIKDHNEKAKMICILRQPIERAYSHFLFLQQRGFIKPMTFEQAVELRPDILSKGLYYNQLIHFYRTFGKKNMLIIRFEDLSQKPAQTLKDIEHFLSIDEHEYETIDTIVNASKKVRYTLLNKVLIDLNANIKKKFLRHLSNKIFMLNSAEIGDKSAGVPRDLKTKYNSYFKEDIDQLSKLTEQDLYHWNNVD